MRFLDAAYLAMALNGVLGSIGYATAPLGKHPRGEVIWFAMLACLALFVGLWGGP